MLDNFVIYGCNYLNTYKIQYNGKIQYKTVQCNGKTI